MMLHCRCGAPFTSLLMAVALGPALLGAQEAREGRVTEVSGGSIRVELAGRGTAPVAGDSARILDPSVPGLDPVLVRGSWVVARAEGAVAWIDASGSTASVQPGFLVTVYLVADRSAPPPTNPPGSDGLGGVLARVHEAVGGLGAWEAVKSVRMRGTVASGDGPPVTFEQVIARPYRLWGRVWSEGYTRTRGYDGERAWIESRRADGSPPSLRTVPESPELMLVRFEADLDGPLLGFDPSASDLTLLGSRRVDGVEMYEIGVEVATGLDHRVLVDATTFLPRMLVVPNPEDPGNEADQWIVSYEDYRSVRGLMVSHARQVGSPRSVRYVIERVEIDVPVNDALFDPPQPER